MEIFIGLLAGLWCVFCGYLFGRLAIFGTWGLHSPLEKQFLNNKRLLDNAYSHYVKRFRRTR